MLFFYMLFHGTDYCVRYIQLYVIAGVVINDFDCICKFLKNVAIINVLNRNMNNSLLINNKSHYDV